jgi:CheY-like chemotaxis protein
MADFKLLLVEDNEQDLQTCRDCIKDFESDKMCSIELVECKCVKDAFIALDNSFDGAIIDLRLADEGDEGNQVVRRIAESHFRIPVVILTGTPDAADSDYANIGVFKKGEPGSGYTDLLDNFWGIHNTGLTRIMGGRGTIEDTLNTVFLKNLLPQRGTWVAYGKEGAARTEKALLRHALNHLLQLLDDDGERSFPEEMYLHPPLTDKIRTGSLVKDKDGNWFAVMNPACDLVIRSNGKHKTDRILLVEIEKEDDVVRVALDGISKTDSKQNKLRLVCGNNHTNYYHWLPKTEYFSGGFLNFRKLSAITNGEFDEKFQVPQIQIAPSFVKDAVARFSSYYARQGQPDIECNGFIHYLTSAQEPKR